MGVGECMESIQTHENVQDCRRVQGKVLYGFEKKAEL